MLRMVESRQAASAAHHQHVGQRRLLGLPSDGPRQPRWSTSHPAASSSKIPPDPHRTHRLPALFFSSTMRPVIAAITMTLPVPTPNSTSISAQHELTHQRP